MRAMIWGMSEVMSGVIARNLYQLNANEVPLTYNETC